MATPLPTLHVGLKWHTAASPSLHLSQNQLRDIHPCAVVGAIWFCVCVCVCHRKVPRLHELRTCLPCAHHCWLDKTSYSALLCALPSLRGVGKRWRSRIVCVCVCLCVCKCPPPFTFSPPPFPPPIVAPNKRAPSCHAPPAHTHTLVLVIVQTVRLALVVDDPVGQILGFGAVPESSTGTGQAVSSSGPSNTHDEHREQEQSKTSGERKLRTCRAALDAFRSVDRERQSVVPDSGFSVIQNSSLALTCTRSWCRTHQQTKKNPMEQYVFMTAQKIQPVLGATTEPHTHTHTHTHTIEARRTGVTNRTHARLCTTNGPTTFSRL